MCRMRDHEDKNFGPSEIAHDRHYQKSYKKCKIEQKEDDSNLAQAIELTVKSESGEDSSHTSTYYGHVWSRIETIPCGKLATALHIIEGQPTCAHINREPRRRK